jgi:hypothetical protein
VAGIPAGDSGRIARNPQPVWRPGAGAACPHGLERSGRRWSVEYLGLEGGRRRSGGPATSSSRWPVALLMQACSGTLVQQNICVSKCVNKKNQTDVC